MQEGEQSAIGKEQEPRSKVSVLFIGYLHDPLNVQVSGQIGHLIDNHLQNAPGRTILFLENADMRKATISMFRDQVKKNGLLASFVNGFSSQGTKLWDVQKIIMETSGSDINTILKNHLIPEDKLFRYFVQQELERLRQEWGLEVENESHSKPVHERIIALREGYKNGGDATRSWELGDLEGGLDSWKKYYQAIYQAMVIRDPEIINDLGAITRKLMKDKEGGSVIILFGGSHSALVDALKRKLGPKASVGFNKVNLMPSDQSDEKILSELRMKVAVDDITYAQDLFRYCMTEHLRLLFLRRSDLATLANNWQTINECVIKVTNSLTMEEIQRLVESRGDFTGFLKGRPEVTDISHLIQ